MAPTRNKLGDTRSNTSETITQQMKDLHLRLHRNVTEPKASPTATLCVDKEQITSDESGGKVPVVANSDLVNRPQTPRSVYTWNQKQLSNSGAPSADRAVSSQRNDGQRETLQRTTPPSLVDNQVKAAGAKEVFYSESPQTFKLTRAGTKKEAECARSPGLFPSASFDSPTLPKTPCQGQVSSDNGLGMVSSNKPDERTAPWRCITPVEEPYDVQPHLHFNIQRAFQRAFKPIDPQSHNSPLDIDAAKPFKDSPLSPAAPNLCEQHQEKDQPSHLNPSRPLRELCPNMMAHPVARSASPLLAASSLARRLATIESSSPVPNKKTSANFSENPSSRSPLNSSALLVNRISTIPSSSAQGNSPVPSLLSTSSSSHGAFPSQPPSSPVSRIVNTSSSAKHLPEVQSQSQEGGNEKSQPCTCNRTSTVVLCKACGEMVPGRMRQTCLVHPNQIFLMDLRCCPVCQSENLKEVCKK